MTRPMPSAAVAATFARIRENEGKHLWITVRDEADVTAEALGIEQRIAAGDSLPLAGLTFAVKDNIDVAGLPTTAAHPDFAFVAERNAEVVERLVTAGALVVGKTNLDQFATGLVGSRSPYGRVASAVHSERVSGGSSAGSGATVGLGIVDFSLGTDTAGSGRVPAAFNRIIGLKPTLGLLSLDGVVPACPSYDTVSIFAPTVALAAEVMAVAIGPSERDSHSRSWPADAPLAAPDRPRIAIPRDEDLGSLPSAMRDAFARAVQRTESLGATLEQIDMTPLLEAAKLLYEGGLVAERAWSYGEFLAQHPEGADPSVAKIAAGAMRKTGAEVIGDQQRLLELTASARAAMSGVDALLIPTSPIHPTLDEVAAEPIAVNSVVGTFTNFVNLMDMSAAAVPAEDVQGEGLLGVSFVAPAFHDQVVTDLAARFVDEPTAPLLGAPGVDVAVFGAHLRGEPLNHQLMSLGARYVRDVATAGNFRMLLVDGAVQRPAVVRSADGGELPGELWRMSPASLAAFLTSIAAPLALGHIELADGSAVIGFTASPAGGERDITELGGWRAYRASLEPTI